MSSGGPIPPSPVMQFSQANNFPANGLSSLFSSPTQGQNENIFAALMARNELMQKSKKDGSPDFSEGFKNEPDDDGGNNEEQNDLESLEDYEISEKNNDSVESQDVPTKAETNNGERHSAMSSSSSKRKRFHPQRNMAVEEHDVDDFDEGPPVIDEEEPQDNQDSDDDIKEEKRCSSNQSAQNSTNGNPSEFNFGMAAAHLAAQANNMNMNKFREFVEAQKRIYTALGNQQDSELQKELCVRMLGKFTQALKDELLNSVQNSFEKVIASFNANEMEKILQQARQIQQIRQQQLEKQKQESMQQNRLPFNLNPMFNPMGMPYNAANPLMALANPLNSLSQATSSAANGMSFPNPAMAMAKMQNGGIFPNQPAFANLNGFLNHQMNRVKNEDGSPRKKRSKVTDSVRGPRSMAVRDNGQSLPASARSSPSANSYFPPTMVPHPLYNGRFDGNSGGAASPFSNDDSEYFDGMGQSTTLTHIHLRKAKLMFFYTRYPPSSVLKNYFPDIQFHKNNTAQLVKWFSNFREFYYMNMEKFAKQYLAEGITEPEQIKVTTESELFKILNVHYNKNNFIPPPEGLAHVVEVTLREFFKALRDGRDAEPSWKKAIYKVIAQYDEHIPDFFKAPAFMTQLEGSGSS
uniref:Prospero domain-containing protein n=2 Tax=Bursaphelenchus xylophilus TaxID=6326 RepID=A0A1I7RZL3_BURXY